MTEQQSNRVRAEWSQLAGEELQIEEIGGEIYAFGSELGCLRLAHKMRVGRAEFSKNLNTWSYCTGRA